MKVFRKAISSYKGFVQLTKDWKNFVDEQRKSDLAIIIKEIEKIRKKKKEE